jgi:hypothetical protein
MTWPAPEDGWYVHDPDSLFRWRKVLDNKRNQAVRANRTLILLTAGAKPDEAPTTTQIPCEQCGEVVTGDSPQELGAAMRRHDWRKHKLRTTGSYVVLFLKFSWTQIEQGLDEILTPS